MRRPRLKWSLGLVAVSLLVLVVLIVVERMSTRGALAAELSALRTMGYPTSVAELAALVSIVPPAANAGPELETILDRVIAPGSNSTTAELLSALGEGRIPWNENERAAVETMVATNATTLASLHAVLQRSPLQLQLVTNRHAGITGIRIPQVFGFVTAARALLLAAGWEAHRQHPETVAAHLGDAFKLARTLDEKPAILVMAICSLATANHALAGLEIGLNQTRFPDAELRQLQTGLDRCWTTNLIERAAVNEFCFVVEVLAAKGSPLFGPAGTKPSATEEWFDRLYTVTGLKEADSAFYARRMIRYVEAARAEPHRRSALMQTNSAEAQREITQKGWRRRYSALLFGGHGHAGTAVEDLRIQLRNRAAHAALAVERYRLKHGDALPPSLEMLVPEFLDRVPQDLYTATPLRYLPLERGYVIYSLGSDLKDDGGNGANHVDITFRVER